MKELLEYFNIREIESIRHTTNLYDKAYYVVYRLFKDVQDKNGNSYLNHLVTVSSLVQSRKEKAVVLLRDVIGNTNLTDQSLFLLGFPETIVEAVLLLTRQSEENDEEFITRLINSNHKIALNVKKSYLETNLRFGDFSLEDKKFIEEYQKVKKKLEEIK